MLKIQKLKTFTTYPEFLQAQRADLHSELNQLYTSKGGQYNFDDYQSIESFQQHRQLHRIAQLVHCDVDKLNAALQAARIEPLRFRDIMHHCWNMAGYLEMQAPEEMYTGSLGRLRDMVYKGNTLMQQ